MTYCRTIRTAVAAASFMMFCTACDEVAPTCAEIDAASLDAATVVMATSELDGFQEEFGDLFLTRHHGSRAVWVFGDGRFIVLSQEWDGDRQDRIWYRGELSAADFMEMLDTASCLGDDDGETYTSSCQPLDAPAQVIALNLPDAVFTASLPYTPLNDCVPEAWSVLPDQDLADLYAMIDTIDTTGATAFVPVRIVLGGTPADNDGGNLCSTSEIVDWTFEGIDFEQLTNESDHILIDAPLAGQIRDFITAHPADINAGITAACVAVDGTTWVVYFDNAPDEEEILPL